MNFWFRLNATLVACCYGAKSAPANPACIVLGGNDRPEGATCGLASVLNLFAQGTARLRVSIATKISLGEKLRESPNFQFSLTKLNAKLLIICHGK